MLPVAINFEAMNAPAIKRVAPPVAATEAAKPSVKATLPTIDKAQSASPVTPAIFF